MQKLTVELMCNDEQTIASISALSATLYPETAALLLSSASKIFLHRSIVAGVHKALNTCNPKEDYLCTNAKFKMKMQIKPREKSVCCNERKLNRRQIVS